MAQEPNTPATTDPAPTPATDPATPPVDPATAPATDPATAPATDPAPAAGPAGTDDDPAGTDPAKADELIDPASYELKLPEGYTLDEQVGNKFKEFCASKKLSGEDTQALLDMQVELREKESQAYRDTQAQWIETARADKEFGGEKFDENLAVANKALADFGTPELKALLQSTGFGNHPEVIRAFVKIGKATGEDKVLVRSTTAPAPAAPDPVKMYANSNMNP